MHFGWAAASFGWLMLRLLSSQVLPIFFFPQNWIFIITERDEHFVGISYYMLLSLDLNVADKLN